MKKQFKVILILLIAIILLMPLSLGCTTPTNGMLIDDGKIYQNYNPSTHTYGYSITYSGDITLCSGTYYLPGIAGDRSGISIEDSDVVLNCNNALIDGQNSNQIGILINDIDITLK